MGLRSAALNCSCGCLADPAKISAVGPLQAIVSRKEFLGRLLGEATLGTWGESLLDRKARDVGGQLQHRRAAECAFCELSSGKEGPRVRDKRLQMVCCQEVAIGMVHSSRKRCERCRLMNTVVMILWRNDIVI